MWGISKAGIVCAAVIGMLSVSASRARAEDPCGLVTKEEMSTLAGFAVDVATPQSVGGATSCVHGAKTRESVQVRTYSGEAAKGAAAMCRGGVSVGGIGDGACLVTRGVAEMLQVTKGARVLLVVWMGAPKGGAEEGLKRIAGKALGRM